ncbi:MAG: HaeIII family restriction endonuclease, partial [Mariniphaga sp.]|nr:HaeIII family restriction endonuclease [Mariniphaga sp.]
MIASTKYCGHLNKVHIRNFQYSLRPLLIIPIISIDFKENNKTTVIVTMDNDWTLFFRIHNASSRIESSLKFDI